MEKGGRSREHASFGLGYVSAKKGFEKSKDAYSTLKNVAGELKQWILMEIKS